MTFVLIYFCFNAFGNNKLLLNSIEKRTAEYSKIAKNIWEYAEVGYKEEKSSKELINLLEKNGFKINKGVAGIPTAFVAEYNRGGSVIGILGEYDALPGLSQTTSTKKTKREGGKVKTTTEKSHGWYEPRMNWGGGDRRKSSGPRKKNMNRAASPEVGTKRKNFPGASELGQLVKATGI